MLLKLAVVTGLISGLVHAFTKGRRLVIPDLHAGWLVPAAFVPQALCFFLPVTRTRIPDTFVAILLVVSQIMLLVFAWLNLRQRGFLALGLGLVLNLLVISANGGWMPISPKTLNQLYPYTSSQNWVIGERLGVSKDIILPFESMVFPLLSDRIVFPPILSQGLAYSIGDVFIALGAFQLLFSISCTSIRRQVEVVT